MSTTQDHKVVTSVADFTCRCSWTGRVYVATVYVWWYLVALRYCFGTVHVTQLFIWS